MKHLIYSCLILIIGYSCNSVNSSTPKIGSCENLPKLTFDIEQIKSKILNKNQEDSLWKYHWQYEHQAIISKLDSAKNNLTTLFPYSTYDSVIYLEFQDYDHHDNLDPWDLENREVKTRTKLCFKKTDLLLKTLNNPNNFTIGECGTPIPHSKIVFYSKSKEIASIIFSCGFGSIAIYPSSPFIIGNLKRKPSIFITDSIQLWK